MNYKRIVTALLALVMALFLLGASQAPTDNVLINPSFAKDEAGKITEWNEFGGAAFAYREEGGSSIASVKLDKAGYAGIRQTLQVELQTIYKITFTARVKDLQGKGAYAEVVGLPAARSAQALSEEWTTYEMYGLTSPDEPTLTVAFSLGTSAGRAMGTAEFKDVQMVQCDTAPPEDALYVWFYDREAWEEENMEADESTNTGSAGDWQSAVVALAFLVLVWLLVRENVFQKRTLPDDERALRSGKLRISLYILAGFCISSVCAFTWFGHSTDMNCFSGWSVHLAEVGIPNFYISDIWTDYPPGYFYPLYLIGLLRKLFGIAIGSPLFIWMLKLPAILADAGCAYFVYRIAKPRLGARSAANLGGLLALCPMVILDSGIWGQIDSILTLLAVATVWFCMQNKKELCALCFAVGLLVKPQMLLFGPILLVAFVKDAIGPNWKKELMHIGISVLVGVATVAVLALPFSIYQQPTWLIELYSGTTGGYPYATVNAYNFFAMLGKNWMPDGNAFLLGLSAKDFGTIAILGSCILGAVLYWRAKDRKAIFPAMAVTLWGIFAFGHNMHERYLFPVMMLLMLCFALYRDKRFLFSFAIAAGTMFVNCVVCLLNTFPVTNTVMIVTSAVNVLGFIFTVVICFHKRFAKPLFEKAAPKEKKPLGEMRRETPFALCGRKREGERMVRKDYIFMLLITLVYAAISLVNLGSTEVPEKSWRPMKAMESVLVDLGHSQEISYLYYYASVGSGNVRVEFSDDGETFDQSMTFLTEEANMYTWQRVDVFESVYDMVEARYVKITNLKAGVNILEMGIYAQENVRILPVSVTALQEDATGNAQAMFDEQALIDESPSYMTEMYFDEIYHARTAYEHLTGMPPYENTHPPLGKVFIMVGIMLFGMNPFGWRIIGTLFGVGMLPLIYVFAKRLFKDTRYAVIACLLFAVDGMHFAQTRIATIDVYGVFFIMAMCYFMYRYWTMNFYTDKLSKTFVPLGLCGIMFGLGAASKWIGFYAGVGLAVAFFYTLYKRYREYLHAKARLETAEGEEAELCAHVVKVFKGNTIKTLLFCVLFFVVIPVGIYLASYLPYLLCAERPYDLKGVWDIQTYMFGYHSKLTATHSFQSSWYSWPLIIRPIWYFKGEFVAEGMMSSIASFGNPAVWWSGLAGVLFILVHLSTRRSLQLKLVDRDDAGYLFICLGAAFLPWVLITRCTFIYHYFASVPFIILFTVMMLKRFERPNGKLCTGAWILCAAALALFALFYPVWSGWEINRAFALNWLRWFDSWWFF